MAIKFGAVQKEGVGRVFFDRLFDDIVHPHRPLIERWANPHDAHVFLGLPHEAREVFDAAGNARFRGSAHVGAKSDDHQFWIDP